MTEPTNIDDHWHLDRKVPLSLIFAMLVQCGAGLWAIAGIKSDVEILKSQSTAMALSQHERDEQQDKAQMRQMQVVTSWLERIDNKLDRIAEKRK